MNVDCAHHPMISVGHGQRTDAPLVHQSHGFGGECLRADGDRARRHRVLDPHGLDVGAALEHAAQVAVGEDARERPIGAFDCSHAHALAGDLKDGLGKPRAELDPWQGRVTAHHVVDQCEELSAQGATRVRAGKVIGPEAARIEQRDGQGITQRKRGGRAGSGCKIERTGLAIDRGIEMHIGEPGERRIDASRDRDQPCALAARDRHDAGELFGGSGVGDRHQHIVLRDHAEIAMARLGGMKEKRRRAG